MKNLFSNPKLSLISIALLILAQTSIAIAAPPAPTSAKIWYSGGQFIEVTFNKNFGNGGKGSNLPNSAWSLMHNGTEKGIFQTLHGKNDRTLLLAVSTEITSAGTVTLSYTRTGGRHDLHSGSFDSGTAEYVVNFTINVETPDSYVKPEAVLTAAQTTVALNSTLNFSVADANSGNITKYQWDAYNRTNWGWRQPQHVGSFNSRNTAEATWTPPTDLTGEFLIKATIWDDVNRQSSASVEITVTQVLGNIIYAVSIISDPGPDKTYGLGDIISLSLKPTSTVNRVYSVSGGTPEIKIKMDPSYGEKIARYTSSSPNNALHFNYTVVEPNLSTTGIAVIANSFNRNGATLTVNGGTLINIGFPGVNYDPNHKVDWRIVDSPPTVQSVSITSTPSTGTPNTYGLGDKIVIAVVFDQRVFTRALPSSWSAAFIDTDFDLQEIWGTKTAQSVRGSGTTTLEFEWEVRRPNFSTKGVAILANTLRLRNGGCHIRNASGVDAILTHPGVGPDTRHKVDWRIAGEGANAPAKAKGTLVTTWAALKKK